MGPNPAVNHALFFFYVVAVLVYIAKYATLTPDIIYSRGASAGDP